MTRDMRGLEVGSRQNRIILTTEECIRQSLWNASSSGALRQAQRQWSRACLEDCFTTVCVDECADRCDGCGMDLECVGCSANCDSLSTRRCAPQTDFISCEDGLY